MVEWRHLFLTSYCYHHQWNWFGKKIVKNTAFIAFSVMKCLLNLYIERFCLFSNNSIISTQCYSCHNYSCLIRTALTHFIPPILYNLWFSDVFRGIARDEWHEMGQFYGISCKISFFLKKKTNRIYSDFFFTFPLHLLLTHH